MWKSSVGISGQWMAFSHPLGLQNLLHPASKREGWGRLTFFLKPRVGIGTAFAHVPLVRICHKATSGCKGDRKLVPEWTAILSDKITPWRGSTNIYRQTDSCLLPKKPLLIIFVPCYATVANRMYCSTKKTHPSLLVTICAFYPFNGALSTSYFLI